jgi:hypothetical protein
VTALVLRSYFFLPGPGAASLCSDAPGHGLSMRMSAALQSPGSRRGVAPHRLCAPLPPLYSPALPCGCNRQPGPRSAAAPSGDSHPLPSAPLGLPLCLWVAVTRPPLRSGRDTSPFRALALETADADSRAPDGLSLRSRPSGRVLIFNGKSCIFPAPCRKRSNLQ